MKAIFHVSILVLHNTTLAVDNTYIQEKGFYSVSFITTLQSLMNTKLRLHRFWPCHENGLIKTIQTIPHNLHVSVKSASLHCGLKIILVYPNPQ